MRPTDIADPVPGGVRVLVAAAAEDDGVILAAMLRLRGFDARTARTAAAALDLAALSHPQAAVVDPDLPGWRDVILRLRDRPDPPAILVLSGHAGDAWRTAAADAGADAYLLKPAAADEMVGLLRRMTARPTGGGAA